MSQILFSSIISFQVEVEQITAAICIFVHVLQSIVTGDMTYRKYKFMRLNIFAGLNFCNVRIGFCFEIGLHPVIILKI